VVFIKSDSNSFVLISAYFEPSFLNSINEDEASALSRISSGVCVVELETVSSAKDADVEVISGAYKILADKPRDAVIIWENVFTPPIVWLLWSSTMLSIEPVFEFMN
jgi:hypothetical protein